MKLGWIGPPTIGYGLAYLPDYDVYGYANMASPNITYYGGVVGYVSGTVEWTSTWVPVVDSPSPSISNMGNGQVGVSAFGTPVCYGTLVVSASIDGEPCENSLRIVFVSKADYYGLASWDTVVVEPPGPPAPPQPLGWAMPLSDTSIGARSVDGAGVNGTFYSFDPLNGGVVGYTDGSVVWDVSWAPVVNTGRPPVINFSGSGVSVQPAYMPDSGTLLLSATINGVLCSTVLRAVFAPRSSGTPDYGAVAWDVLGADKTSEFWTDFINTSEYL